MLPLLLLITLAGAWSNLVGCSQGALFVATKRFLPLPSKPSEVKIVVVIPGNNREGSRMVECSFDHRSRHAEYKVNDISSTLSKILICELAWETGVPPLFSC